MNRETVEAFIARGGPIQVIPRGVSGEANITHKQRINPDRTITNEERQARKLAAQAIPVLKSRLGKERGVSKPRPPRPSRSKGKRETRKNTILAVLKDGPVSLQFVAGATGIHPNQISVYLRRLRDEGRVVCYGEKQKERRWGLPCR